MINKYGLDEGAKYIEQNTLLDLNNFIPSWEAGDEEKKEVSLALLKLRQKFNQINKSKREKEDQNLALEKDV